MLGPPGAGKSFLMRHFSEAWDRKSLDTYHMVDFDSCPQAVSRRFKDVALIRSLETPTAIEWTITPTLPRTTCSTR